MVSILMLTHNAPAYVKKSIKTLRKTEGVLYELIVVDNASKFWTRWLLKRLKKRGMIDFLYLNKENSLFAKGNNIASGFASKNAQYYLLLNSDIEIKDGNWLKKLIELHPNEGGIVSYGVVESEPVRADGFCLLIDSASYNQYKLDEHYAWWWSVTKLESQVLQSGKRILAVRDHEKYLHHYGGKSGGGGTHHQCVRNGYGYTGGHGLVYGKTCPCH